MAPADGDGTNRPEARPQPGGWTLRARLPGAILLGGFLTGALPLWMAQQATRHMVVGAGPGPDPRVGGEDPPGGTLCGPSSVTRARGAAAAPLGLGLAVALRPLRRGRSAAIPPRDPLQIHMARCLEAAGSTGRPTPPLGAARNAALAWGAWPRAVAMALGGLRWAGPPPGDATDEARFASPGDARGDAPEGTDGDAQPSDGGWPTPRSACQAAALAAVPWEWARPLQERLLLVWPTDDSGPAGTAAWNGIPAAEWRWATAWMASRSRTGPTDPVAPGVHGAGAVRALTEALARESQWLAAWRRRLPAALPVDPRRPRPSAATTAGRAAALLGRLLAESAELARSLRGSELVPPAVADLGHQLEAVLLRLGWQPGRPGGPVVWPAWHLTLPHWALWLPHDPGAAGRSLEQLVAGLARAGWGVCRLVPIRAFARLRLSRVAPGDRGGRGGEEGGQAAHPREGKAGWT
ncbi:MAG TPA: hypothetical protein VIL40_01530 [Thermaerobacter sp.]